NYTPSRDLCRGCINRRRQPAQTAPRRVDVRFLGHPGASAAPHAERSPYRAPRAKPCPWLNIAAPGAIGHDPRPHGIASPTHYNRVKRLAPAEDTSMKELIKQYLDDGISRRQLMTGLSALGVTTVAANAMAQSLSAAAGAPAGAVHNVQGTGG